MRDDDAWDLRSYREDGVVRLRGVLTLKEVDLLRSAVDDQFANRRQSRMAYDFQEMAETYWRQGRSFSSEHADRFDLDRLTEIVSGDATARPLFDDGGEEEHSASGVFFYEAAGWRKYEAIREVAFYSRLPELCARLLDSSRVNFWEDTTFVKTPGATLRTPFHQDFTYFQISGRQCCVVWIPLDETTPENGALEYVIGSHRWGRQFAPSVFVSQTPLPDSPHERLPDIEARRDQYNIRVITAEPGDVIVHDVMTVHGAAGNRTAGKTRRALSFRYCGDDIRYCDKKGAIPQPWIARKPEDGEPLNAVDYPLVWPRSSVGGL
jgi:hypothetical protein